MMTNFFPPDINRALFEQYPLGLLISDKQTGAIININDKILKQLDYYRTEIINMTLDDVLSNKYGKTFSEVANLNSHSQISDFKLKTKHGNYIDVTLRLYDMKFENKDSLMVMVEDITLELKNNAFLYQLASIVEFSDDAIISKDLNGIIISWNKTAEKVYGYSSEEMIGGSILKIIPDNKKDELYDILKKIEQGERIENYETVRIRKDGKIIDVSVTMSPVKNATGKVTGTSAIERDITSRKLAEEERLIREKQLEEAQQIAHLGYWEYNVVENKIHWSDELYKIYGLNKDEFIPTEENFFSKIYPDDKENIKNIFEKALHDHRPFELNYRIVLPNGDTRTIYGRGEVLLDDSYNPAKLRGVGQDITQQKRAERRLAAQFEITKLLANSGKLVDSTPKILQAICEGMDWQIGELWLVDRESHLLELEGSWSVSALDSKEFIEVSKKCKFGKGVSLQGRVWESGYPIWSSHMIDDQFFPRAALAVKLNFHTALSFPVLNKNEVTGVLAFYKIDISEPDSELLKMLESLGRQIGDFIEKKKSEPALKESEELYRTLVETSPDAITYTDLSGKILFCNQQAAELFGFRLVEDIIGQNVYAFIAAEDQKHAVENEHNTVVNGKTKNIEYTLIKKDGAKFPAEVNTSIVFDAENKPKAFIGIMRDISSRKLSDVEIKSRIKQQAVIAELGQAALGGMNIQSLMDKAAEIVSKTLELEFCDILELQEDDNKLCLCAGNGWKEGTVGNTFIDCGAESHAGFTLLSNEPVIVENIRREKRFKQSDLLIEHNVIAGISVVIKGRSKPFGVIGAYTNKIRAFTKNDSHFLQAIANVLVTAIERKHVEAELEKSLKNIKEAKAQLEFGKKRLEFLTEVSKILNSSLDYNYTLKIVAGLITRELADWCVFDIIDDKKLKRVAVSHVDINKFKISSALEKEYPPAPNYNYVIYGVINSGEAQLLQNIDDELIRKIARDERHYNILKEMGVRSSIVVPLKARDEVLGVLSLISASEDRFYDGNDIVFAQDLASRAAGAIDNSRLFENSKMLNEMLEHNVKERTSELEISNTELEVEIKLRQNIAEELNTRVLQQSIVAELGQKALTITNIELLLTEAVEMVSKTLNAEFCGIYELSNKKELVLKAGKGWSKSTIESRIINGDDSFIQHLLTSGETVMVENFVAGNKFKMPRFLKENNIMCGLSVVIKDGKKYFGILGVYSSIYKKFTLNDSSFLKAAANVLAGAIERKHAEEMSAGLIEAAPDAVIIVNDESKIILVNSQTEKMFGYKREELLDKNMGMLVPAGYREQHSKDITMYFKKPYVRPMHSGMEVSGVKKDGTKFPAEISLSPFNTYEGYLVTAAIRDISERKKNEQNSRQQA